jgi:hypothetical protein
MISGLPPLSGHPFHILRGSSITVSRSTVASFTPNIQLEQLWRGDLVGGFAERQ